MTRRIHHLDAAELREWAGQIGVGQLARLRVVVALQPAQVHARRSEVGRFRRHAAAQLALDTDRPLRHIRRRLVELIRQNEGRRAGPRKRLVEAQIRPEALGRLVTPDRERRVSDRVENGIADVANVVDAASTSDDGLRRHGPRDADARRDVVLVRLIRAPPETTVTDILNVGSEPECRIPLIGIAGPGPNEYRLVRVAPIEIDVHDRVVRVVERLIVFPAQPVIHGDVRAKPPAVLRKTPCVFVASIISLRIGLIVLTGDADQEIREIRSRFRTINSESAIECGVGVYVDLFITGLKTGFERVVAEHSRKNIAGGKSVVRLGEVGDGSSHAERVEGNVLDPLDRWCERDNARLRAMRDARIEQEYYMERFKQNDQ